MCQWYKAFILGIFPYLKEKRAIFEHKADSGPWRALFLVSTQVCHVVYFGDHLLEHGGGLEIYYDCIIWTLIYNIDD